MLDLSSKNIISKNYSSSSSSSAIAATVDEIVPATTITTVIQIATTIVKNVKINPSGVIVRPPIPDTMFYYSMPK